jgi:hypothetical protein
MIAKIIKLKKYNLVILLLWVANISFAQQDSSCTCIRMTNHCDSLDLWDTVTEQVMIRPASKWKTAEYALIKKCVLTKLCHERPIVYPCDCAEKAKFEALRLNSDLYDEITIPEEYRDITMYNAEGYPFTTKILIKPSYKKLVQKYNYPPELKITKN